MSESVETMEEFKEVVEKMFDDVEAWDNGNKSAAARVRKATLELAKLGKAFRKQSVAEAKK